MTSDGKLEIGVVGLGYWGPNLARNIAEHPRAHLRWLCDFDETTLAALAARHPGARTTTRLEDLTNDPELDAIAIVTPVSTHYEIALQALDAGKHVFVEKPLATSSSEAIELIERAKRANRVLMPGHTFLYSPPVMKIKELIDSNELGELYFISMSRVNLGLHQPDVSVIWDLAAHDLAIMDHLIEQRPTAISAVSATHFPGGMADVAYLTVQFENDLIAHFHVNWLSPVKVRQVLIGGDRRMVLYDDIESTEKVKVYDRGVRWNDDPLEARRETLVAYRLGDMFAPVLDQTEALRNECAHFIESIRNGTVPATDGHAGLRTVTMLAAAERSLLSGGAFEKL